MKKILKLYILIGIHSVLSQNSLNKLDYNTLRLKFYNSKNDNERLLIAQTYLDNAILENNAVRTGKGFYLFAKFYSEKGELVKANSYYDKVIRFTINSKDSLLPSLAYFDKGYNFYKREKIKKTLENLILAEKYASKNNNVSLYYGIKQFMAVIKTNDLGEVEEALEDFNKCLSYFKLNIKNNEYMYVGLLLNKSDAFVKLNKSDSANYFNKLGFKESIKYNFLDYKVLFSIVEGSNLVNNRKYNIALDSINSSIKILKENNFNNKLSTAYFIKGKCYKQLNNEYEAVKYFLKVDSLYNKNEFITPEFIEGYQYLINFYKSKGDKSNQIKFLEINNKIEKEFKAKYQDVYKRIKEKYEIPNLMRKKESEINTFKIIIILLGILVFILLVFGLKNYFDKKKNKKKFLEVIQQSFNWQKYPLQLQSGLIIDTKHEIIDNKPLFSEEIRNEKSKDINADIIGLILESLSKFEREKKFLVKSITAQSLAESFNTNSKYITNIINDYKGKRVNDYVNDLRIEYAVLMLQNDSKLRNYNLESLADEFGFNSFNSFNSAFIKKTGIKPSFFIKNINT